MKENLSENELIQKLERQSQEYEKALKELREVTEQLKIVNKKLEESEALKSHFISNVTNEIINPFASIIGLAKNILIIKEEDKNWKKAKNMANLIHSEAFSLDFQLKNIFVAAEIEAGEKQPEISNVDIGQLIKNLIDSFEHEAIKKELQINFDNKIKKEGKAAYCFKTDPEALQVILANLLSNAVKYSNATSEIDIKLWLKNDTIYISVIDYGSGISETNQKIIFDRFKRLDSSINSINRGHGLGLSIVKALLDMLNGEIEIKSQTRQGSTFTITIPEAQPEEDIDSFATDGSEIFFDEDEIF